MKALNADKIREASYVRNNFAVTCDHGTKWEDVLQDNFWVHVAQKIKAYDIIEVRSEDKSFWGELLVMSAGKESIKVVELRVHHFTAKQASKTGKGKEEFVSSFNEKEKWRVLRTFDNKVIETGFDTEKMANEYIELLMKEKAA